MLHNAQSTMHADLTEQLVRVAIAPQLETTTPHLKAPPPEEFAALEALICEFHNAALSAAVVSSWSNGLNGRTSSPVANTIAPYLPRQPALFLTLERWISETRLPRTALLSVDTFFTHAAQAANSVRHLSREAAEIGAERAAILHRFAIIDTWRGVCATGLGTLDELGDDALSPLADCYRQSSRILYGLLAACCEGASPCLSEDGNPFLPSLPQRRRARRIDLSENCTVYTGRRILPAFAKDISLSGIGLRRVPELPMGAQLKVELSSGRTFPGLVAWSRPGAAGIRFNTPLSPDDPMISA